MLINRSDFKLLKNNNKRIKEIFEILDFKQIIDVLIFPIIFFISVCFKPFCKKIWIIAENPNEACDNGYILFKYLRENKKDINAFYVINPKSSDYEKVKLLGNVIKYRSLKHWIYYLNASKIIVTQKYANPSPAIFYFLHTRNILKIPRVYLKHGITKDESKMLYYNRTKFRLFICGAKREYDYMKNNYGYPKENVVYTGFARFDNLEVYDKNNISNKKDKIILVAPTWRNWIHKQKDFDIFMQNYYTLINDDDLIYNLKKNNIQLKVVLHKNMKKFEINYIPTNKNVSINHNEEENIQDLLNKADLLITDYSSIFFDIAYRKRPIIYYQFDKEKYRKNQLPEGYFSYEKDGFGEILKDKKSVTKKIKYYIENDFQVEEKYYSRMDNFFERRDKNNCKRILDEIEKI